MSSVFIPVFLDKGLPPRQLGVCTTGVDRVRQGCVEAGAAADSTQATLHVSGPFFLSRGDALLPV